ncbi:MAG: hypothetical protein ABII97_01415 [Patescibacteria group bacterium]
MFDANQNFNKGFTFIGVTVATFVATVGLMAIFSLSNMAITSSNASKMRLIASGLAQEGIEIVRSARAAESNWRDWDWYATSSPMHSIGSSENYCIDTGAMILGSFDELNHSFVCAEPGMLRKFDSLPLVLYNTAFGLETPFYRWVKLERMSEDEVKVVVEVKWKLKNAGDWHNLKAESRFWKWK